MTASAGADVEEARQQPRLRKGDATIVDEGLRAMRRTGNPKKCRIGALSQLRVPTCRFAEYLGASGHIEYVVSDLKREAQRGAIPCQGMHHRFRRARGNAAEQRGGRDERARFRAMNLLEISERKRLPLPLEIEQLPPDHATSAQIRRAH